MNTRPSSGPEKPFGDTWLLLQGNALLGNLVTTEFDWPWLRGSFHPTAAFEAVRPVFAEFWERAEEFRLRNSNADKVRAQEALRDLQQASEDLNALGLRLVNEQNGEEPTNLLLYIRSDWFEFRRWSEFRLV
jgi:hypothetical protein